MKVDNRKFFWLLWLIMLFGTIWYSVNWFPEAYPHPEYIPTILNGLVTAMSVLMAFAFFSITSFQSNITDKYEKRRSQAYAIAYLFILFFILLNSVLIGYVYVVQNELNYAFITFLSAFIIMCGIIMDMWTVNFRLMAK